MDHNTLIGICRKSCFPDMNDAAWRDHLHKNWRLYKGKPICMKASTHNDGWFDEASEKDLESYCHFFIIPPRNCPRLLEFTVLQDDL